MFEILHKKGKVHGTITRKLAALLLTLLPIGMSAPSLTPDQ